MPRALRPTGQVASGRAAGAHAPAPRWPALPLAELVGLQRAAGNQAVVRLLGRSSSRRVQRALVSDQATYAKEADLNLPVGTHPSPEVDGLLTSPKRLYLPDT